MKRLCTTLCCCATMVVGAGKCHAEGDYEPPFVDGYSILRSCESLKKMPFTDLTDPQLVEAVECGEFLAGMNGMNAIYRGHIPEKALYCPPHKMSGYDMAVVVVDYLHKHDDILMAPADYLVYLAFADEWPCK